MTASRARRSRALDERDFHAWLARRMTGPSRGLLPLGDDAAALSVPPGRVVVLSTDSLVEGTHFLRDSPAGRIGAAAANVSLSDIAAKGARPAALLIALIVPPGTPRRWAEDLARGADRAGAVGGAPLVGGDTKPGPTRTVVSTVLGWGRPDRLSARTGARPGDLLVTTGTVGRGGLAAHRFARTGQRSAAYRPMLAALLEVRPRVREGPVLAEFARAMLDTSDGLADSSWLLAEASGCRVSVDETALPLAPGLFLRRRNTAGTTRDRLLRGGLRTPRGGPTARGRSGRGGGTTGGGPAHDHRPHRTRCGGLAGGPGTAPPDAGGRVAPLRPAPHETALITVSSAKLDRVEPPHGHVSIK